MGYHKVTNSYLTVGIKIASNSDFVCGLYLYKIEEYSYFMHKIPKDFSDKIKSSKTAFLNWGKITPLAKNEWVCFIISAKKIETRDRRIKKAISQIQDGKRRPCCWAGCPHK